MIPENKKKFQEKKELKKNLKKSQKKYLKNCQRIEENINYLLLIT